MKNIHVFFIFQESFRSAANRARKVPPAPKRICDADFSAVPGNMIYRVIIIRHLILKEIS